MKPVYTMIIEGMIKRSATNNLFLCPLVRKLSYFIHLFAELGSLAFEGGSGYPHGNVAY